VTVHRKLTVTSHLEPGQAEALVEMAVPVLRDMLRDYRRKQAEEAKRREEEEQPVPVTAEVRP